MTEILLHEPWFYVYLVCLAMSLIVLTWDWLSNPPMH
jgi:hypothetical protein